MSAFHPTDYKKSPLLYTDQIRFVDYYKFMQQDIAMNGASIFLQIDANGYATYTAPNIPALTKSCEEQDSRFLSNSNLQIQLASAYSNYQRLGDQDSWNAWLSAQAEVTNLKYNAAIEEPRQRFFRDQLTQGMKEANKMTVACTNVFRSINSTIDTYLSSRVQQYQSRISITDSPHFNLIDAIAMLVREMGGNFVANREALLDQISKLRIASTLSDCRFVVDAMQSVKTSVEASIGLFGGNGQLTNSQYHYKLLSKISPSSSELTFIRILITQQPNTTPFEQLRAIIKTELDRGLDPMHSSIARTGASNSRGSAYHAGIISDSSNISTLAGLIEDYNHGSDQLERGQDGYVQQMPGVRNRPNDDGGYEAFYGGGADSAPIRRTSSSTSYPPRFNGSTGQGRTNVCTDFLHGDCARGDNCRFGHPPNLAGALAGGGGGAGVRLPSPPAAEAFATQNNAHRREGNERGRSPNGGRGNGRGRSLSPNRSALKRPAPPGTPPAVPGKKISFGNNKAYAASVGRLSDELEDNGDYEETQDNRES